MLRYHRLTLLLVASLFNLSLYGQPADPLNISVIPPSPTAAALAQYALTPVNLSSGIPSINIPLYEIADHDVKLPISLSYHGGGIKVGEIASWVGLGWSLNAGGVVSRTVMGLPDERPIAGFISTAGSISEFPNYNAAEQHEYLEDVADHHIDAQPDEFFFNFAGYSGKFVIDGKDAEGALIFRTIPYQDIKIIAPIQLSSFKFITPDGSTYVFDQIELTRATTVCEGGVEQIDQNIPSAWYLSSLTSVSGTVITFDYADGDIAYYATTSESRFNDPFLYCADFDTECETQIEIELKRLQAINFSTGSVKFYAETEREDAEFDYALSKIEVVNAENEIVKSYDFQYHYHPVEDQNCNTRECKRLMLDKITERGSDGISLPPYQLEYDSLPMPSRNSKAQDHWGYYNGALSNQTLVPAYPGEECLSFNGAADGANRNPNTEFAKAAILKRIHYPLGGSASYTFEGNRFGRYMDEFGIDTFEANEIPKIMLSAFASANGTNSAKPADTFFVNAEQLIRISTSIELGNPPCECEAYVVLSNSLGEILFERGTPDAYENCITLTPGTYYLYAEMLGSGTGAHATITTYYYQLLQDTVKSMAAGGLRIKEVHLRKSNEDAADDQVVHYSYQMDSDTARCSGFLISSIVYDYGYTTRGFSELGGDGMTCDFQVRTSISQSPIYSYNGNPVFYPEVTEVFGDRQINGSGSFGRKTSVFSFAPDIGKLAYPFAPPNSYDYKRGLLLNEKIYDDQNRLITETSSEYVFETNNHFNAITGLKVAYLINDQLYNGIGADAFQFAFYNYTTQWVHLREQTKVDYFHDGTLITSTTSYFYDNPEHIQLTRKKTVRSDGTEATLVCRYPADYAIDNYSGNDPMIQALDAMRDARHMHNTVVEKYSYILTKKSPLKANLSNQVYGGSDGVITGSIKNGIALSIDNPEIGKLNMAKDTFLVAGSLNKFKIVDDKVLLDTIFQLDLKDALIKSSFTTSQVVNNVFICDVRYRGSLKFDYYNSHAQPVQFHQPYGEITSVVYDDISGDVSAVFHNTNLYEVGYTGFESTSQGQFVYDQANIQSEDPSGLMPRAVSGVRYYNLGSISHYVPELGKFILTFWSTVPVTLSGTGYTVASSSTGEVIGGFTYYQYQLDFSGSGSVLITGNGKIDELRFYPVTASVTSYSYKPLAGITEICDENSYISHFEYDHLSRFQYAEDHFGNALSFTEYHYRDESNSDDLNFIRSETSIQEGLQKTALSSASLSNMQSRRSITYIDGIGRPFQKVEVGLSPQGKDIVTCIEYDANGRQPRSYLPYPSATFPGQYKINALADLYNYYAAGTECEQTEYPFSEKEFENSPLNTVLRQASQGESWSLGFHNVRFSYRANYLNEVRLFLLNESAGSWSGNSFYAPGTLLVTETTDENDNVHVSYQDNNGKVIMEKHPAKVNSGTVPKTFDYAITCYGYDDLERLQLVITPEGYNKMVAAGNFAVKQSDDVWNFFCQYNKRGLVYAKKMPGIDWNYLVYDQLNREALSQDPNLRTSGKWMYHKFDAFGRMISSGLTTIAGKTYLELQDDLWQPAVICHESMAASSNGYTNVSFPTTLLEELSVNYYDHYDFNDDGNADYSSSSNQVARSKGKITGQFNIVIGSAPAIIEKTIPFYDYLGRIIETKGNNHEGEAESESFVYNFSGDVLQQERIHHYSYVPSGGGLGYNTDLIRKTRNEYDHAGRLKNTYLQVNEELEIWTGSFSYNELGQMIKRKLHNSLLGIMPVAIQKSMQTIDYKYNIRGWLTTVNDIDDVKENGDYWGMELHYNDGYPLLDAEAQYGGNIVWMAWKSCRDEGTRMYGFNYDPLNRLVKAKYGTASNAGITETDHYTVDGLSYDENGNIEGMKVHGAVSCNAQTSLFEYGVTDDLNYSYNGNQLKSVSDNVPLVGWGNSLDFKDVPGVTDYAYDANGNMLNDANKSIDISYNHLNLPSLFMKAEDHLKVTYNANGEKRKEEITENLQVHATGYFGDIIHEDGRPKRILFEDGYLLRDTSENWIPYYYIKDHLGNVRVVFKGQQLTWTNSNLTFEINANEEGAEFPKFKNVSTVRNEEVALQGNWSGKLSDMDGPYTDVPVKSGDTLQLSVYYYYAENNPQKSAPSQDHGEEILRPTFSLEMQDAPRNPHGTDFGNQVNKPSFGIQLNITGLSALLSGKKKSAGTQLKTDTSFAVPEAYILLSLRDTSGQEINQWRVEVDTGGYWSCIADSVGIHVPDGSQQYQLRVSMHNDSEQDVWFDTLLLKIGQQTNPVVQVNHYYPYGNLMADISWQSENSDTNNYLYNSKELHRSLNLNLLDYGARWYDPQVGRWWVVDPLANEPEQVDKAPYAAFWNDPVMNIDPDGKCPNCATAGIGSVIGGLMGGGIEILSQLYDYGIVNNWNAVGGAALQGVLTGGTAGFTGGASLLSIGAVSGSANAIGGAANRIIQGKSTTLTNVVADATVGAALGAGGKLVGNAVNSGTNNLSKSAKGKLGEAVTEIKYGVQGYKSAGKAEVLTGGKTSTGRPAVAKYDFDMINVFTGGRLTVESKFNSSTLTRNQVSARPLVTTPGGLIIDRTTSQGLGNIAKAAIVGAGTGVDAQKK
ncbi:MAG: hypothetical protein K1X61_00305 [Chitinophagales bacterium]|nr:hypothetical protein [Chitinophagales bacterium]